MAVSKVISIKTFSYRGAPEEWSNDYHFVGDPPADDAGWRSLCNDLGALEKDALTGDVEIVRFLCYADDTHDSTYTYDLASFGGVLTGSVAITDEDARVQGDSAYCGRWPTGRRTSTGKPIYLRKYFHGGLHNATDPDRVADSLITAMGVFVEAVASSSGDWPGMAGPDGVAPTGYYVMPELTTRTLKRRGRRPT